MNYEKSTRLVSLQEQNTSLQEQNTSLQEQNTSLQEQNTSLQEQKYHITNEIVELKIRQNEILNSRVWKFSVQLRRIYRTFVPNNSFLEKLILGLINLHHSPVGIRSFLAKSGRFIYRYLPHNQQSRLREEKIKEQNLSNSISDVILNHTESLQQNLSHKNEKTVNLVVSTFFDFDGNNMFFGGAERYLIELVRLIRQLGYNVEVYQCGNDGWVRYYQDIRVTGIATPGLVKELKQKFHQQVEDGQLTIYFAFFIASDRYKTPSIGISHGIYWDDADLHGSASAKEEVTTDVLNAISHVSTLVSVDTNTINWLRATEFSLSKHCVYIPNFVDLEQFPPTQLNNGRDNQRVVILYPRRLYDARGFWLVERLVAEFIEKYPEVDFHFVGKANAKEEHAVQELITRFPERVKWYFLPPEKMHEAYQQAHIALIPTVQSEGTSLSCLEALSSGNAVIATNVGGLPNLIFPDYNGLLIEPNVESLRKALTQLIENPKLRLQYSQRGIEIAATFNIEIWRERWKTTLQKYLPAKESLNITPLTAVFFPKPDQTWLTSSRTRMRRLAEQLAESGVEVFWVEPSDRRPSGINRVHLIGTGDDLYLSHPWVIINNQDAIAHLQKYDKPISIFDIDEFPSDQVKQIATLVDYIIASSDKLSSNANIENGNFYCIPNGATLKKLLLQMSRQDF
jgi:glycosyltransferase involved in cell wall biosynthesis